MNHPQTPPGAPTDTPTDAPCHPPRKRPDWLLWGSFAGIIALYALYAAAPDINTGLLLTLSESVFELINRMWWGIAIGMVMIGVLSKVPREFVIAALGRRDGFGSIARATFAGVLLDLCSHGILMVGAKLYERGARAGQVMAFLVASPWNSLSLTLILIALIGVAWTLAFIVLSMIIALITGLVFDRLVAGGTLPANPNRTDIPDDFHFWREAGRALRGTSYTPALLWELARNGVRDSRMVLRWIFFGVLLASLVRAFVSPDMFAAWFAPTMFGLFATLIAATIIEVCSEGSTPLAADLLTRADAPGNSFAFLMTGVATDYTEIMVLREATRTWKIALFLPIVTVPQIILIAALINLSGM